MSKNFVVAKTEYGPVKGVKKSTDLGRNVFDFQSIPYMKAPLGKLRFRDAQPPEKWTEALDVSGTRPSYLSCMMGAPEGTEDAGILGVTTPYLDRKLPVAVYIHGGGFQFASGGGEFFGGDFLLQKDIVFVLINYRVGPIGFLSLEDPKLGIPGNAGLKDQVFALKWVQKNIANFGGDPNDVTVFGTSAGGASVHLLMVSEMSKGLFHKAIPMSGTSFIKAWPFADKKGLTERLAKSLGWDGTGGERKILEILENADGKDLVQKELQLLTMEEKFVEDILFPFTPTIEPYLTSNTFLPKDPVLMARDCWSKDVNCLFGGTSLEGGLMGMFGNEFIDQLKKPENFGPTRELGLNLDKPEDRKKAIGYGGKIRKLYFGDTKQLSPDMFFQYYLYAGDLHFWHGIYRAVLSRVKSGGNGKTFLYRFDLQTSRNMCKTFFKVGECDGAAHGDDMSYIFNQKMILMGVETPPIGLKEFELIKKFVDLITSFIINGDPNTCEVPEWQPLSKADPLKCMNMTNGLFEAITLPEEKRLKVWDEILSDAGVTLY